MARSVKKGTLQGLFVKQIQQIDVNDDRSQKVCYRANKKAKEFTLPDIPKTLPVESHLSQFCHPSWSWQAADFLEYTLEWLR